MKYCENCGSKLDNNATFCPNCGCNVNGGSDYNGNTQSNSISNLKIVAKIFMILTCAAYLVVVALFGLLAFALTGLSGGEEEMVISAVAIIFICVFACFPLAWILPMTVHYCRAIKNNRPVGIFFKICTLIFVNLIAGILMLIDQSDNI